MLHPDLKSERFRRDAALALAEAVSLAHALPDITVVGQTVVPLQRPMAGLLFGKGKIEELKKIMKDSRHHGMVTFDQSLFSMYQQGLISYEDALRHADSANDLRLTVRLSEGADSEALSGRLKDLNLVDEGRKMT